jgi:PhoPQ-activated pathogenicity-related protein
MRAVHLYVQSILSIAATLHAANAVEFTSSTVSIKENAGQVALELTRTDTAAGADVEITTEAASARSWSG